MIKTKIVCTIGPKTQPVENIGTLIEAGMNVVRMNFSHGSHEFHAATIVNCREYLAQSKNPKFVAILLDTKGPEIRTGKLVNGGEVELKAGNAFTFHSEKDKLGDDTQVYTTYDALADSVHPGDRILVGDGLIGFKILSVDKHTRQVRTIIENDGMLGETKGVNLPNVIVQLPAITEKDASDIAFGVKMGVDYIAASFIRKANDVFEIRELIKGTNIKIISKIENQEGLDNFDEILEASDGIMVARYIYSNKTNSCRGDLGTEIPVEQVARAQKMMIRKCNCTFMSKGV
jgi:pyruvate kinase